VVSGQWSVVSGQWSVVSGQWSVVSEDALMFYGIVKQNMQSGRIILSVEAVY
jgi:hypothetical protein